MLVRFVSRIARSVACLILFAALVPHTASAQTLALASGGPRFLYASAKTTRPVEVNPTANVTLRRRVSLNLERPTVGSLLSAISRQTGLEFVYSRQVLPVNREVGLHADSITVAAALTEILMDAGLDVLLSPGRQVVLVERQRTGDAVAVGAIVGRVTDVKTQTALAGATVLVQGTSHSATTGSDGRYRIAGVAPGTYTVRARYIGYAPGTASVTVSADQEATADFTLEKSAQRLDEVVTTGTVVPTEVKALPTPISVITAEDIQRQNLQRVDQVFRGMVPGTMAWDRWPGNDNQSWILVRGTSTMSGVPGIKTFIDGVEVADPQFIATIDPNSIERVEITRGPQASTLYGAGALSGVMQIFTRNGQLGRQRPELMAKVSAGGVGGFDGRSTAFQTDNTASVLGGGDQTSYNLGGSYRHVGEWVPSYYSTDWGVSAGVRTIQGPLTLSSSARYADEAFDMPWDTRFQSYTFYSQPFYQHLISRQQTYGATASLHATRIWQHTVTLGYDRTYVANEQTRPRFTAPDDSLLTVSDWQQARTSLLYHTDLMLQFGNAVAAVVTAGVNYDAYDQTFASTFGATGTTGALNGSTFALRTSSTNTGYFGQVQVSLVERLFLTGGIRAERSADFGADFGTAWSPRVGAAYILGLGAAAAKLRASYGESIRAPVPGLRDAYQDAFSIRLANPALAPERQRGVDGGVDLYVGRMSLGVTYYNQRAIDLIARVVIPTPAGTLPTDQFQNLARVKNEGWEFEAHLPLGPVQLRGTYSITNSTVQKLPPGYPAGDLQVGDPILGIPHTSAGATVTYSPLPQTTLTASMTNIGHWINSDDVAQYGYYYGGQPYRGSNRAYWIEYPTVTKLAVGVSQVLARGLTAFAWAENLTNNLRFEHSNTILATPRHVLIGANMNY